MDDGIDDDEGGAEGFFKKGMLAPNGVFAEVPAVVAPEHDDGVVSDTEFVELRDDLANLRIGVGDAGSVVFADGGGEFRIRVRVLLPTIVFHEFAGSVPGGLPSGFSG